MKTTIASTDFAKAGLRWALDQSACSGLGSKFNRDRNMCQNERSTH